MEHFHCKVGNQLRFLTVIWSTQNKLVQTKFLFEFCSLLDLDSMHKLAVTFVPLRIWLLL